MSVIKAHYDEMFGFLENHFNHRLMEDNDVENALDLIDLMIYKVYEVNYNSNQIQKILELMESFLAIPMHETGLSLYIRNHVGVEMIGLKPKQFLQFVYYRLVAEQWKRK